MQHTHRGDLTDLLNSLAKAAGQAEQVTLRDVFKELGDRSITPVILVISIVLISPISGIPGVPTISAGLIVLLAVQVLLGQRHLWLPDFLLRRKISGQRLAGVVTWLRGPCRFVDRHTHPRLTFFTQGALRIVTLAACVLIPLGWPLLEILPLVTSIGALTVALLVFGLFSRDGLYVLAGYGVIALTLGAALFFLL